MWDPTARPVPVIRELECSRDEDGVAHATVTLMPWDTSKRLAYEDGVISAVRIETDAAGGMGVRRIVPSAMHLLHLRLTVVDCTGFPEQIDPATGGEVPFDFGNAEHVGALRGEVYAEVLELAEAVQAKPSQATKRPQDRKAKALPAAATAETAEDFEEGEGPDPSQAPSTPVPA